MVVNVVKNSLENHWMPFTDNRGFKASPRLIAEASGEATRFDQLLAESKKSPDVTRERLYSTML